MSHGIYYPDIKTTFFSICPNKQFSEMIKCTRQKQQEKLEPPGVTIVAYIESDYQNPFNKTIEMILASKAEFKRTKKLHVTLLGIYDDKRYLQQGNIKLISRQIKDFIEQQPLYHTAINLSFKLIRLGAFYDDGRPRGCYSDGTVIAIADPINSNTKLFRNLGDDVASFLRNKFSDPSLKRKYPTVWCTLGYFDDEDFDIANDILDTLEKVKEFNAIVEVRKLKIVKYKHRSLDDAEIIEEINLE